MLDHFLKGFDIFIILIIYIQQSFISNKVYKCNKYLKEQSLTLKIFLNYVASDSIELFWISFRHPFS